MSDANDEFLKVPASAIDWHEKALDNDTQGCPWAACKELLREAGLRPTRQRLLLGWILFSRGDRHVTAEMVFEEAIKAKLPISLATVYNTLNQFTQAGLMREITAAGQKAFFDTNPSAHHHFLIEGEEALLDIPESAEVVIENPPAAPEGFEVAGVDVVVRLRRIAPQHV